MARRDSGDNASSSSPCIFNSAYQYTSSRHSEHYSPKQRMGFIGLWNALLDNTKGQGYSNTNRARGRVKTCYWVTAVMLLSVALLYSVVVLLERYLRYDVGVVINVVQEQTLPFPAVTICNMSPVKKSAIAQGTSIVKLRGGDRIAKRKKRDTSVTSCASGWSEYKGNCYTECNFPQSGIGSAMGSSWYDARDWCSSHGAQLTSISDKDELIFVKYIATNLALQNYWIGLYKDNPADIVTYWLDGNPSTYREWDSGQPSYTQTCFVLTAEAFSESECLELSPSCICKLTVPSTTFKPSVEMSYPLTSDLVVDPLSTDFKTTSSTSSDSLSSRECASTGTTATYGTGSDQSTETETATSAAESGSTTTVHESTKTTPASTVDSTAQKNNEFQSSGTGPVQITTRGESAKRAFIGQSSAVTSTSATTNTNPEYSISTADTSTSTATIKLSSAAMSTGTTRPSTAVQCCCRCCQTSGPSSCNQCLRPTLIEASSCASKIPPPPSSPTPPVPIKPFAPTTETRFQAPSPLTGSQFPERPALTVDAEQQLQMAEVLAELPLSAKVKLGFTLTDLVINCTYDNVPCELENDFDHFHNPTVGNCYVFNSGWNVSRSPIKWSLKPGVHHGRNTTRFDGNADCWNEMNRRFAKFSGLRLILNLQQYQYVSQAGSTAGIVVLPLSQNVMPFPEDEGFLVSPGRSKSIGLSLKRVRRLTRPYGNCIDSSSVHNLYNHYYPVNYSTKACLKSCYQRLTIDACNCSDPYYPADTNRNVTVCQFQNITQNDCMYALSSRLADGATSCDCPDKCNETLLESHISTAAWPSSRAKVSAMKYSHTNLILSEYDAADDDDDQFLRKNLAKVDVFYNDFVTKNIKQLPAYPLSQLVVDFGGTVGLWLGFAAMTFIEVLEFFVDLTVMSISFCCSR